MERKRKREKEKERENNRERENEWEEREREEMADTAAHARQAQSGLCCVMVFYVSCMKQQHEAVGCFDFILNSCTRLVVV